MKSGFLAIFFTLQQNDCATEPHSKQVFLVQLSRQIELPKLAKERKNNLPWVRACHLGEIGAVEAVEAVEAAVAVVVSPSFRSFFCAGFHVLRACVSQELSAPRRPDHHRYTSL